MRYNKKRYGSYVNIDDSNWYDLFGNFKYDNLIPLLGNGLTNMMNLITMTYAFKYAIQAGVN
jgi:hypothetical protein